MVDILQGARRIAMSRNIRAAYLVAHDVYAGKFVRRDGVAVLSAKHKFKKSSAHTLISVYQKLMMGDLFTRGLSAAHMDAFLTFIGQNSGPFALKKALGALQKHLTYYESKRPLTLRSMRSVAEKHRASIATIYDFEAEEEEFRAAVRRSMSDSSDRRLARLKAAPRIPKKKMVTVIAFDRNHDVVAEVLLRANGRCEHCRRSAPFMSRRSGEPYLEVHHIKQLACGGEDTVENAQALCPNCHRRFHYGVTVS